MRHAEPAKIEMGNIHKKTEAQITQGLLSELIEQLKLTNNLLEEIHDEVHELSNNRGGGF
jgi:hypothetical protein